MLKKSLLAVAVAGLLVFGAWGAASAEAQAAGYPPAVQMIAGGNPILVGGSTPITATFPIFPGETVWFGVTETSPSGGSLSSIAFAAGGSASVGKPVIDGKATSTFSATAAGTYMVTVSDEEAVLGSTTITVNGAPTGAARPANGGTAPVAAIWLALGAIGIGGIAITAALARRRAQRDR